SLNRPTGAAFVIRQVEMVPDSYWTTTVSDTIGDPCCNGENVTTATPGKSARKRNRCVGPPGFTNPPLPVSIETSTNATAGVETAGGLAYVPSPPPHRRMSTRSPR